MHVPELLFLSDDLVILRKPVRNITKSFRSNAVAVLLNQLIYLAG